MEDDETPMRRSIGARRNPATADAIREAAQAVLQEAGYAGFSIEAVARRARAGKPTIYRWWRSKAALLLDVYHRQKGEIKVPDTGDVEKDLTLFVGYLLHHWRTTPSGKIFRSILAEAQLDEDAAQAIKDYAADRCRHIAQMLERARNRGELPAGTDPQVAADLVLSFAWTRLFTHRLDVGDGEVEAAMRCLIRGASNS